MVSSIYALIYWASKNLHMKCNKRRNDHDLMHGHARHARHKGTQGKLVQRPHGTRDIAG